MESWGRRKRAVNTSDSENSEEDMTLSQEILVLDFGDNEKTSQFLKTDEPLYAEFDKGELTHVNNFRSCSRLLVPFRQYSNSLFSFQTLKLKENCIAYYKLAHLSWFVNVGHKFICELTAIMALIYQPGSI